MKMYDTPKKALSSTLGGYTLRPFLPQCNGSVIFAYLCAKLRPLINHEPLLIAWSWTIPQKKGNHWRLMGFLWFFPQHSGSVNFATFSAKLSPVIKHEPLIAWNCMLPQRKRNLRLLGVFFGSMQFSSNSVNSQPALKTSIDHIPHCAMKMIQNHKFIFKRR